MENAKTAVLMGAGDRGTIYSSFALKNPGLIKIVGVAEPVDERRQRVVRDHGIANRDAFASWEEMMARPRMADGAIIATQDAMHVAPSLQAMEKGYHVLLEKPMALTADDCSRIVDSARESGVTLTVCHVLRYTDFFSRIDAIISEGILGDIYTIYHAENVSYYHMAHSYVRGNWRRSDEASPMILAKCCHDLDLICWYARAKPLRVSSIGALGHFTEKNAPRGAPARCTDGCPGQDTCPYNAVHTYLDGRHMKLALSKTGPRGLASLARFMLRHPSLSAHLPVVKNYAVWRQWPTSTVTDDLSGEGILRALREGPYGRCVYRCDNDQVDHQESIIEFDNGITAVLRMHGHSHAEGRSLRIDGSRGTLRGRFDGGGGIEVHLHATGKTIRYPVRMDIFGHTAGDLGIMEHFARVLRGGAQVTGAAESLTSHLLAFAIHESRMQHRVISMEQG